MRLPEEILPILEKITEIKGCETEFWKSLEGYDLTEMWFQLSSELLMSDIEEYTIPNGYVLLAYIFDWESNCQFSGWYAIENKKDELDKIQDCYRQVGLESEANALAKAKEAWFKSNQNHEIVGEAYRSEPNDYREANDRFDFLSSYFSANASSLLYAPAEM